MVFFTFPEDARWNPDREDVEVSVILAPYEGTVRVPRRVFQGLLDQSPTPERCMEAFHLQRTRFELVVERKLRRRQLTDAGNGKIMDQNVAGEPTNATDPVLMGVRDPAARNRLIVVLQPVQSGGPAALAGE